MYIVAYRYNDKITTERVSSLLMAQQLYWSLISLGLDATIHEEQPLYSITYPVAWTEANEEQAEARFNSKT